jgi:hypothetical protein
MIAREWADGDLVRHKPRSKPLEYRVIRFLFRLLAYLGIGGGFVALVLDGARSLANQEMNLMSVAEMGMRLFGDRYLLLQPAVERNLHPFLWDPVLLRFASLPAFAVLLALGFLLLRIGRKPEAGVGVLTRA